MNEKLQAALEAKRMRRMPMSARLKHEVAGMMQCPLCARIVTTGANGEAICPACNVKLQKG